jgi:glycosyltransferase involved in cell wall biosynthesis
MNESAISCVCMTYGRTWLLAEAVESYLRQDYKGTSELIIVNDFEGLTLSVDDSRCKPNQSIQVVNLPKRMNSLNDKFDLGVKMAQYGIICMWDDDDICLPNRLSYTAAAFSCRYECYYLAFSHHWNLSAGKPAELLSRGIHGGDAFTRASYLWCNGSQGPGHNDQNFVKKIKDAGMYATCQNPDDVFYVYRWGGITGHTSCYADDLATCMRRFHEDVVRDRRFVSGKVKVVPAWAMDYAEVCG